MTLVSGNFALLAIGGGGGGGGGGGVHYGYYCRNRDNNTREWKQQPKKLLSKKLAREQRLLGWLNFNLATLATLGARQ